MKMFSIMGFNYEDLSAKGKHAVRIWLDEFPFDYEDEHGSVYSEYPSEWEDDLIAEHCNVNEYIFDENGKPIHHLIIT